MHQRVTTSLIVALASFAALAGYSAHGAWACSAADHILRESDAPAFWENSLPSRASAHISSNSATGPIRGYVTRSKDNVPWVWVARLGSIIKRVWRSPAVRRGAWTLLKELGLGLIANEITRYIHNDALPKSDRETMGDLSRFVQRLEKSIKENGGDIAAIRREMDERYGYTLRRLEAMDKRLARLDARLAQAEHELGRLVRRDEAQARQLAKIERTIVDQERRIQELEGRVVDHEGRIHSLDERMTIVAEFARENRIDIQRNEREIEEQEERLGRAEDRIARNDYYNKHVFGIGGQLLYARPVKAGLRGVLGAAVEGTYLFDEHVGVFVRGAFAPVQLPTEGRLRLPEDTTRTASLMWDHYIAGIGFFLDPVPGNSPVALRFGVAGGVSVSQLIQNPSAAGFLERSEASKLRERATAALLIKADLGFAPPQFPLMPYLSAGYTRLMDPVAFEHTALARESLGSAVWQLSVGVRWRFTTGVQFEDGLSAASGEE